MAQAFTGKALLEKVEELNQASPAPARRELARLCGYSKTTKKGEERINVSGFYQALLEAKGLNLGSDEPSPRRGRDATFRTTVQKRGQILLGSSYTRSMGLKPGDQFEIKLGYKHIHLVKRGVASEEEE